MYFYNSIEDNGIHVSEEEKTEVYVSKRSADKFIAAEGKLNDSYVNEMDDEVNLLYSLLISLFYYYKTFLYHCFIYW